MCGDLFLKPILFFSEMNPALSCRESALRADGDGDRGPPFSVAIFHPSVFSLPIILSLHQASCPLVWSLFQSTSLENTPSDFQIARIKSLHDRRCTVSSSHAYRGIWPSQICLLCIQLPFCGHLGHRFLHSAQSVVTLLLSSKNITYLLISPTSTLSRSSFSLHFAVMLGVSWLREESKG